MSAHCESCGMPLCDHCSMPLMHEDERELGRCANCEALSVAPFPVAFHNRADVLGTGHPLGRAPVPAHPVLDYSDDAMSKPVCPQCKEDATFCNDHIPGRVVVEFWCANAHVWFVRKPNASAEEPRGTA